MKIPEKHQSCVLGLLLLVLCIVPAGATEFTINGGGNTCVPAESTTTLRIALSDLPSGLSGLNVSYAISDPSVAVISGISPASWAMLPVHTSLPSGQVQFKAIDLNQAVNSGVQSVAISDLTVHSLKVGTAQVTVTSVRVEDDAGGRYNISPVSRTICFGNSSESVPESTTAPPTTVTTTVQTVATTLPTGTITPGFTPQKPTVSVTTTVADALVPAPTQASGTSEPIPVSPVSQTPRIDRMTTKTPEPSATAQSPLTTGIVFISLIVACLVVLATRKNKE